MKRLPSLFLLSFRFVASDPQKLAKFRYINLGFSELNYLHSIIFHYYLYFQLFSNSNYSVKRIQIFHSDFKALTIGSFAILYSGFDKKKKLHNVNEYISCINDSRTFHNLGFLAYEIRTCRWCCVLYVARSSESHSIIKHNVLNIVKQQ